MQVPNNTFISGHFRRGETELAVKRMEEARNVFWNRLRTLNGPFDHLPRPFRETLPLLAASCREIGLQDAIMRVPFGAHDPESEVYKSQMRDLDDWQESIAKLREIPGYERALCPLLLPEVRVAAREGPVVIVAANENWAQALIFVDEEHEPKTLPLLCGAQNVIKRMTDDNEEILRRDGNSVYVNASGDGRSTNVILRQLLRNLWQYVVAPIIRHLGLVVCDLVSLCRT